MYSYLYTRSCFVSHSVAYINEFDCYHLFMGHPDALLLSLRVYRSITNITYRMSISTFTMFQSHANYILCTSVQKSDIAQATYRLQMYFVCIIQRPDFIEVRIIGNATSLHLTHAFVLETQVVKS